MLSLMPSLASFVAALALVFYSFAILGIELFSGKVYKVSDPLLSIVVQT